MDSKHHPRGWNSNYNTALRVFRLTNVLVRQAHARACASHQTVEGSRDHRKRIILINSLYLLNSSHLQQCVIANLIITPSHALKMLSSATGVTSSSAFVSRVTSVPCGNPTQTPAPDTILGKETLPSRHAGLVWLLHVWHRKLMLCAR